MFEMMHVVKHSLYNGVIKYFMWLTIVNKNSYRGVGFFELLHCQNYSCTQALFMIVVTWTKRTMKFSVFSLLKGVVTGSRYMPLCYTGRQSRYTTVYPQVSGMAAWSENC